MARKDDVLDAPPMEFAGFIEPQDDRWRGMLERVPHDFYHLPDYVAFSARHEGGRPAAFYAESGDAAFLAPLLVRKIPEVLGAPESWCDLTAPYGYPCFLFDPGSGPGSVQPFLQALADAASRMEAVCGFFRLHPLLPVPSDGLHADGTLVCHGQTVTVDLFQSEEEIWRRTRDNHKDDIRRLEREGFGVCMDDWRYWEDFIRIYHQTMERVNAGSSYFFSAAYFEEFRKILGPNLHLSTVLSPSGDIASSGLITEMEGIVELHLAATDAEFMAMAPSKMMFDGVRRWSQARGNRYLHLGGGVGGRNDSLYRFKAGFSKLRQDFHTFRMVFHTERYERLVQTARVAFGGGEEKDDFFPQYRKNI